VKATPSWRRQIGSPAQPIAGDVLGYSGFEENVTHPVRRLEIGTPCPMLIIGLDSEFRVSPISSQSAFTCQSLFVGPAASPVTVEHSGKLCCVEVSLNPWAAAAIFGPAEGWPGHVMPLSEIWKKAGGELEESLAGVPSWTARFMMLDDVFGVAIPAMTTQSNKLRWAWNEISRLGGHARGTQTGGKPRLEFSTLHLDVSGDGRPDSQGAGPTLAISESEDMFGPDLTFAG
jgi:hypothetical protein